MDGHMGSSICVHGACAELWRLGRMPILPWNHGGDFPKRVIVTSLIWHAGAVLPRRHLHVIDLLHTQRYACVACYVCLH